MIDIIKEYSYSKNKNITLTEHFKVGEFRSYNTATKLLTTDKILIEEKLPQVLEKIYKELEKKYNLKYIIITSGYRSADFEYYLSGNYNGYHVKGMAADIVCYKKDGSIIPSKEVCMIAEDLLINGIGYGNNYTHIDVRNYKSYFDETNGKTGINSWYDYFNERKNNYFPKTTYIGNSIIDALKNIKVDNSYSYRTKIAKVNNIKNYTGSASQNITMLNLLKQGKLMKP